jgi:hypothetical protein
MRNFSETQYRQAFCNDIPALTSYPGVKPDLTMTRDACTFELLIKPRGEGTESKGQNKSQPGLKKINYLFFHMASNR